MSQGHPLPNGKFPYNPQSPEVHEVQGNCPPKVTMSSYATLILIKNKPKF
jgi:hypothetical protein